MNVIIKLELVIIKTSPSMVKTVNNKKSSEKDYCPLSSHVCPFDDFTFLNYESEYQSNDNL